MKSSMHRWLLLISLALLTATAAHGEDAPVPLKWTARPTPDEATGWSVPGTTGHAAAAFACDAALSGRLESCRLLNETPAGAGDASRSLLDKYRFEPGRENGQPVVGHMLVTFANRPKGYVAARITKSPTGLEIKDVAARAGLAPTTSPVDISCIVTATGRLESCRGRPDRGDDQAVVDAALSLIPRYAAQPATLGGKKITSLVYLGLGWNPAFDTPVQWRKRPSPAQLTAVWPAEAAKQRVDGSAVIRCKVSIEGAMFECVVLSETPPGFGFGDAALALSAQFQMEPATKDGKPVETVINIPIPFTGLKRGVGPVPTTTVMTNAPWIAAPTYAEAVAAFPEAARRSAIPGLTTVACNVRADGFLNQCAVIAESPRGQGFGFAALSLTRKFRVPAQLPDGTPTKGMAVHVPITFPISMLDSVPRTGKPQWVSTPTAADLGPLPKAEPPVTVRVTLDCAVGAGGHLADCKAVNEAPSGFNLSASAVTLADKFVLSLWTAEGLPTAGGRVLLPVRYDLK